jgi:hypothetical protein
MLRFLQALSDEDERMVEDCWRDCGSEGSKIFHIYSKYNNQGKLVGQPSVQIASVARLNDAAEKMDSDKYLNDELIDYFAAVYIERLVCSVATLTLPHISLFLGIFECASSPSPTENHPTFWVLTSWEIYSSRPRHTATRMCKDGQKMYTSSTRRRC